MTGMPSALSFVTRSLPYHGCLVDAMALSPLLHCAGTLPANYGSKDAFPSLEDL